MDYLIGKLPDQTKVQHDQTRLSDLINIHDQHITLVYHFWQTIALIYDKTKCHR